LLPRTSSPQTNLACALVIPNFLQIAANPALARNIRRISAACL
jgi:hypothetical protein